MVIGVVNTIASLAQWGAALLRSSLAQLCLLLSTALSILFAFIALVSLPGSYCAALISRLLRASFLSSKYGLLGIVLGLVGFVALSALTNPYMRAELDYAHERASAVEIVDADRRWIGILPPASFKDWSNGSLLPPDHVALPVTAIPPIWRACIVYLEDREFDGLSRSLGIDPLAILKAGWQTVTGDRRRGASTLYMQVVRTLHGQSPNRREAPGEVAVRKAAELLGANALVGMFADRDAAAGERFVAMHLPLVIGAGRSSFGDPLHGIELASRLLFGLPAKSLSVEGQAILAAAVKAPVLMAPPADTRGHALAVARWQRVKARADYCLRSAFAPNAEWISNARTALAALALPQPAIDPELKRLLPKDPVAAWQITVNPVRRATYFARHELTLLKGELERVAGADWRGRVMSVRLSTSVANNHPFAEQVGTRLRHFQATVPNIELGLTPGRRGLEQAHVVVACADHRGKLRRIYSSHDGLLWNRSVPIGSVAKIVAAVVLGRRDEPRTGYCRAPIPGFSSVPTDAKSCAERSAWISAREAFARSNNLAIHWALRHRSTNAMIGDIASALRLPPFANVPPTTALTIGTLEMTPAEMLRLAGGVGAGILGFDQDMPLPSAIEEIAFINSAGVVTSHRVQTDDVIAAPEIRRLFPPRVRSFAASMLRSTSDNDGTLRALYDIREQLEGHLYAKTGTVSVLGTTLGLHIAGSFRQEGKPWSFLASITAPSHKRPVGRQLVAGRLAALARTAICTSGNRNPAIVHTQ